MNLDDLITDVTSGKIEAYAVAFRSDGFEPTRYSSVLIGERARRITRRLLKLAQDDLVAYAIVLFARTRDFDPYDVLTRDPAVLVFAGLSPAHVRRLKMRRVA